MVLIYYFWHCFGLYFAIIREIIYPQYLELQLDLYYACIKDGISCKYLWFMGYVFFSTWKNLMLGLCFDKV